MIFLFVILFAMALYNTVRFVSKKEIGNNYHIRYFYVLLYTVIIARLTWFCLFLNVAIEEEEEISD